MYNNGENTTEIKKTMLTEKELKFIEAYLQSAVVSKAMREADMKEADMKKEIYTGSNVTEYGYRLLATPRIRQELNSQLKSRNRNELIAPATEVLQFYTSVMRGEVLDQFGIEASLDTRIKAANELAKHTIEMPRRLQAKGGDKELGSVSIKLLPREQVKPTENEVDTSKK